MYTGEDVRLRFLAQLVKVDTRVFEEGGVYTEPTSVCMGSIPGPACEDRYPGI